MKRLVEYKRNNLNNVGGLFILKPGVNEVDEDLLLKAMEIQVFSSQVDDGTIVLDEKPAPKDLSGLKPGAAIALVKKTVDRELLGRWFDAETRKSVLEAINAQLDAMDPRGGAKKPAEGAGAAAGAGADAGAAAQPVGAAQPDAGTDLTADK